MDLSNNLWQKPSYKMNQLKAFINNNNNMSGGEAL